VGGRSRTSPLGDLSQRVQAISPDKLGTRLATVDLPIELRPVADQLNALLARLDEAFEREKRFTTPQAMNSAHRSPELRMLLEVAASRPRTSNEWSGTVDTAMAVLARAQLSVNRCCGWHGPAASLRMPMPAPRLGPF